MKIRAILTTILIIIITIIKMIMTIMIILIIIIITHTYLHKREHYLVSISSQDLSVFHVVRQPSIHQHVQA